MRCSFGVTDHEQESGVLKSDAKVVVSVVSLLILLPAVAMASAQEMDNQQLPKAGAGVAVSVQPGK